MGIEATRGAALDQATKHETKRGLFNKIARLGTVAVATLGLSAAMTGTASAEKNIVGTGFSEVFKGNVGPLISETLYGNTSNPSGNGEGVEPSFSPGPFVCESSVDCSGPTDPGISMGDFLSPIASGGESNSDFANGVDNNIDFSLNP